MIKFFYKISIMLVLLPLFTFVPATSLESEESEEEITKYSNKIIIKSVETIVIFSNKSHKIVKARIDTGATQSSIDTKLAKEMKYSKNIGFVNVITANGIKERPLIEVDYELAGKKIRSSFTVADRSNLNYPVLIGRNDLNGFLIDPSDE